MEDDNEKLLWLAGGVLLGTFAGYALAPRRKKSGHHRFRPRFDDDRPPIIVKSGSIEFTTATGWADDGDKWEPDQPKGKPVRTLVAFVSGGGKSGQTMDGEDFEITYRSETGDETDFRLYLAGHKPKLKPKNKLRRKPKDPKTVMHGTPNQGRITLIRSQTTGEICEFPHGDAEIEFDFVYKTMK